MLDANVILRFLLADHDTLSPRAQAMFRRAAAGELELLIPSVIAAECVYTLKSFYKMGREDAASALAQLLSLPNVEALDGAVLREALQLFATKNVDFADAYLAALGQGLGHSIGSFDRDLEKPGAKLLE
ncbi:hypothetical protein Dxin01_02583 [Deinococcus xinjiangensis]|uniref:PIN domain-containing protein n=1 Tax=Deinococcus xinjiangensis TaxID=457454 RepID=A0ABP9VDY6_9DEIO